MTAEILTAKRTAPAFALPRFGFDPSEARALVTLAAPMTGTALVNTGMSVTDTVMMGWMGPTALAAGAIVSDVYSIVFYFMAGILSIISPMVARAMGAKNVSDARRAMHHGFAAACIVAILAFAAVWHASDFVHLFGVDQAVVSMGRGYAHALAFAVSPMLLVAVWRNLFDAIGRPRVYLAATLSALPLNAAANQILMFGWGPVSAFGLAGAGMASALVAFGLLAGLAVFGTLNAGIRQLGLFNAPWRFDREMLAEVIRLGLPIGFFTIGEVGIFLLATVVVSLFGVEALAAHAITLRVAGLIYTIPVGLSQATTVRVSHAIGRDDAEQLRRSIRSARYVGAASGLMILLFLAAGADILPALFLDNSHGGIAAVVASLLVLLGVLNLAQGFAAPATAVLRAFKDTRAPMMLCLTAYWLIGMPIAYLAAFEFGYEAHGIWSGLALGVVAAALFMNVRLFWQIRATGQT